VHCIYVTVGESLAATRDLLRQLQAPVEEAGARLGSGVSAMRYTTVIAAPSGSPCGQQYLAPYAATALAEYIARSGGHALIVHDSLSRHFPAARRALGFDWAQTQAAYGLQGSLFDRCAQLAAPEGGAAREGGSVTCLALLDTLPFGPQFASDMDHISARTHAAHTASLADARIRLSAAVCRQQQDRFPVEFESLGATGSGHRGQGDAIRHYATRSATLLRQLRETAVSAVAGKLYGIDAETDRDAQLDLLAKLRTLLLPTRRALALLQGADAGKAASARVVAELGLEGLQFRTPEEDRAMSLAGEEAAGSAVAVSGDGGYGTQGRQRIAGVATSMGFAVPGAPPTPAAVTGANGSGQSEADTQRALAAAFLASRAQQRAKRNVVAASGFAVKTGTSSPPPGAAPSAAAFIQSSNKQAAVQAAATPAAAPEPIIAPATPSAASSKAERVRFSAPTARAPAIQFFADIAPRNAAAGSGAADENTSAAAPLSPASGTSSVGADPSRLLLTLFLTSHCYVQRVPFERLLEYESRLFALMSSLPAPQTASRLPGVPSAVGGFHHPLSSQAAPGSLLAAMLSAPVDSATMIAGADRFDVDTQLRSAALSMAKMLAANTKKRTRHRPEGFNAWEAEYEAAMQEDAAREKLERAEKAAARAAAAVESHKTERGVSGVLNRFADWAASAAHTTVKAAAPTLPPLPKKPSAQTALPPAAAAGGGTSDSDDEDEGNNAAPVTASEALVSGGHVRLDPGLDTADRLPEPWRTAHFVVAEFTRVFNDEPLGFDRDGKLIR
jgi:hypothetical protein